MGPKKKIRAQRTQAERMQARRHLGTLHQFMVGPTTLVRYGSAIAVFLWYRVLLNMVVPSTYEQLETQMCSYLDHLWSIGETKSTAGFFPSAVQYSLNVKRQFGAGRGCCAGLGGEFP